ncbi:DUF4148 domain-containing protein [Paraburkholderia sp. BL10I2N1]|uniref:DUF4148 domain-containing protein n=1 Tax=Paraburkholderia sp. BL10I2N1 TaxID=1938796 RepID=UPI00105F056D|nr:DUF4148 domain-containing protein [Paraburkholderia sp. BL10I2N1]TDN61978.1 uncharacterized protein DUF4148 [Paraburkholderia sp. BL10I2N1]
MKSILQIAVTVMLAVPVASFAQQPNEPLTRAQVRAELAQVVKAGYNPGRRDIGKYPADIQAAEARIATQHGMVGTIMPGNESR